MGRSPSINNGETDGLKKGPWTPEEDRKLTDYIRKYGQGNWQSLPKRAGLNRCGKSCRLRWTNYLRPDIKRGNFSPEEEQTIIDLHSALGNKWSMIATRLPGRTDNEIKNYWNTHLRKKLLRSGIDPTTHQRVTDFNSLVNLSPDLMNPQQSLAKIQLLGNILQILSSNPLPNFFGGSDIRNQFDGISIPSRIPSVLPNMDYINTSGNYQPVFDTFETMPEENWLPELVPAAAEISSGNHVDSVDQSMQILNHECGRAVDDGSFWKDVFDDSFLASSSFL